jgi:translation initiation factor IF-2
MSKGGCHLRQARKAGSTLNAATGTELSDFPDAEVAPTAADADFDAYPDDPDSDDLDNYALWTFSNGSTAPVTCQVQVYVPTSGTIVHVGGDPAYYTVYASASASGAPIGSFDVDQRTSQGTWISGGAYRIARDLTVMLHSRGIDFTATTPTYAHIAISAARLTCSA